MATAGKPSGLVIQALEYLGRDTIDEKTLAQIQSRLTNKDLASLVGYARYAPAWLADILRSLSAAAVPRKDSQDG